MRTEADIIKSKQNHEQYVADSKKFLSSIGMTTYGEHEIKHGNRTIKILHDEDAFHPRKDSEPLGELSCFGNGYSRYSYQHLSDKGCDFSDLQALRTYECRYEYKYLHDDDDMPEEWYEQILAGKWEDMFVCIYLDVRDYGCNGLRLFDHGEEDGADGVLYISVKKACEELGLRPCTLVSELAQWEYDYIYQRLTSELDEYDEYLQGNCWWFSVEDADGEIVDSCSGFIGDHDVSGIADHIAEIMKDAQEAA
jgi:hypothetical protein